MSSIIKDPRFNNDPSEPENDFREDVIIDVLENHLAPDDEGNNVDDNDPDDEDVEEIEDLIVKEAKQMIEFEGLKDEIIKSLLKDDKDVEKRPTRREEYFSVGSIQNSAIPLRSKVLKVNKDRELMEQLKAKESSLKTDLKKKTKDISESTVDRINLSLVNYDLWKIQVPISK